MTITIACLLAVQMTIINAAFVPLSVAYHPAAYNLVEPIANAAVVAQQTASAATSTNHWSAVVHSNLVGGSFAYSVQEGQSVRPFQPVVYCYFLDIAIINWVNYYYYFSSLSSPITCLLLLRCIRLLRAQFHHNGIVQYSIHCCLAEVPVDSLLFRLEYRHSYHPVLLQAATRQVKRPLRHHR